MTLAAPGPGPRLGPEAAATYATWFACLADPTRVRLLHAAAASGREVPVGALADLVGIAEPTCSHHLDKLAEVGFVRLRRDGTATLVSVGEACRAGLPHAADVVTGAFAAQPGHPTDLPEDVTVRPLREPDWPAVRRIYAEGIATGNATFETRVPTRDALHRKWLLDHRWVAEADRQVAGWATIGPVSARACYSGVGETSIYVAAEFQGRGIGKALIHKLVTAADEGHLWTLQAAIFPENKASLALHRTAGFRTVGFRERIARLDGHWRDTVLLERRASARNLASAPTTD
jgi:L-amino acid N-acyltransferase YncA/DNA-binding transcriptional ArsR family regulator